MNRTTCLIFIAVVGVIASSSVQAAVYFDGTDDVISCGHDASIDRLTNFTIACWVNFRTFINTSYPHIVCQRNAANIRFSFIIDNVNRLSGSVITSGNTALSVATLIPTLDIWYHIVMTYDDADTRLVRLFANATEVTYSTQQAATGTIVSQADIPITIGDRTDGDRPLAATMSDVAIWDRVLSQDEINLLYSARLKYIPVQIRPDNLVAYWTLDDVGDGVSADGKVFSDKSGNGNDGVGSDGGNDAGLTGESERYLTYPVE